MCPAICKVTQQMQRSSSLIFDTSKGFTAYMMINLSLYTSDKRVRMIISGYSID